MDEVRKGLVRLWSAARTRPYAAGAVSAALLGAVLAVWVLMPPRVAGKVRAPQAVAAPPPKAVAQVMPEPGDLCSTQENRHPARTVDSGRYLVNPNEWNAVGGLCVQSRGGADFRITQSGVTGRTVVDPQRGPGAYAHITTPPTGGPLPIRVDKLQYATSSWRTRTVDSGTYNASYDLWYSSVPGQCSFTDSAELMIWIDSRNKHPSGKLAPDPLRVGALSFSVYEPPKPVSGGHTLIVYALTTPVDEVVNLDLRAFTRDAVQRGYVPGDSALCAVQAGFEVWDGGVGLATESFSFSAAAGIPSGAVTSALPGLCLEWPDGARAANVGTCNAQPSQSWSRPPDGTLVHAGLCLENGRDGALSLVECDGTPEQRWIPDAAGRIVNGSRNACLDAGTGGGAGRTGAVPRARTCDNSQGQVWYPPV
ncbi:hypothetical protein GCM10023205_29670 [Yinghuangia aomiensis]|uniref:Ricin B lectin domain-containing protein n=1 Tax=Yinghuangia aomiensis TaxID=676205 RepID=A0ABP9H8B8_9ACTN